MTAEDSPEQTFPQPNGNPPLSHVKASAYRWPDNPWTDHMINWLKQMWKDNKLSAAQMGKVMGFSRNAILGKANRLQLTSHKAAKDGKRGMSAKPKRVERFKPRPAYPPPKAVVTVPEFLGITLEQLEPQHCRYPRGDRVPFTFCGQPIKDGSSYCPACHALVYYPMSPARRTWFNAV